MTEHHQDHPQDRIKKPRHKKFQNQSYGERMAAQPSYDAPETGGGPGGAHWWGGVCSRGGSQLSPDADSGAVSSLPGRSL